MHAFMQIRRRSLWVSIATAALLLSGCAGMEMGMDGAKVMLGGDQEVPPVSTSGSGSGTIKVAADGSVSGSVATTRVPGLAAHIHIGAMGKNGPVIIPLQKTGDGGWAVPAGAKLNDAQMAAYKAGGLYLNVI